jgi:hypothetical protein
MEAKLNPLDTKAMADIIKEFIAYLDKEVHECSISYSLGNIHGVHIADALLSAKMKLLELQKNGSIKRVLNPQKSLSRTDEFHH